MMSNTLQLSSRHKKAGIIVASMLLACTAQAQLSLKRQKYDEIAAKYKNEHAVYTNVSERLVISEEGGELVANRYDKQEKLFISDLSLNTENTDEFSYGDFYPLTGYGGESYIPEHNDYKKLENARFGEGGNGYQTFYDDQREVQAFYSRLTKKSVTVTHYSNTYENLHLLLPVYFKKHLPLVRETFEIEAPAYVKMGFIIKGLDTEIIKRTVTEQDGKIIYKFTATDVPAYKQYAGVPDGRYYIPHIIPYIVSYRLTGARKDSVLAGNTDELYKFEHRFLNGINIKTDKAVNQKVAELTQYASTDREKAARIYDWVQKNMHYIAFENGLEGFVPRPADTVFKRMYGDCKDMASILEAMCRKAGLKAYFTLIGSDNIPYKHAEVPLTYMYDHMICAVDLNGEWIFLDGTDRYLPFGSNRVDLQGKEALIAIDKNNYKIVTIPVADAERNTFTDRMTMNIDHNDVSGTVSQRYTGYNAWTLQHHLSLINQKDDKDKLARTLTGRGAYGYLSPKYSISATEGGDMDVNTNAEYSIPGYAQKVGKQYYINMNIKTAYADSRINDTGRKVPYYFDNKDVRRETVVLNIPEGYKVTYLPKDVQGGLAGEISYKISYKTDAKAKTVTLTKEYDLKTMSVSAKQFDEHNKVIDDLRKQYKETVVLTAKK